MNNSGKFIRAILLSGVLSIAPLSANAGSVAGTGGATEITQILNNAELGIQTIHQAMIEVQAEMTNYYAMLQQLPMGVGEFSVTAQDLMSKYQSATGMFQQLNGLYGSVGNMKDFAQQRFQSFAASGLDWKSYVEREKAMTQNKNDRYGFLNSQERGSIDAVKKNYDAIQQYQGQIGSTTGTHGAMTVMNGQMNTLLGQMNQMLEQMAVHDTAETADKQDKLAEKVRSKGDGNGFARSYNQSIYDAIQAGGK